MPKRVIKPGNIGSASRTAGNANKIADSRDLSSRFYPCRFITVSEAAGILGCQRSRIYQMIKDQTIIAKRQPHTKMRIAISEFERVFCPPRLESDNHSMEALLRRARQLRGGRAQRL